MSSQQDRRAHETQDARVRPILWVGAGLAAATAISCLVAYGFFRYLDATREQAMQVPVMNQQSPIPPAPRLQDHPTVELQELRDREDERLNHYGWIDRPAGKIHIPIDRAMQLELERGFPTRKEQPR